jgi:hypothetical protein
MLVVISTGRAWAMIPLRLRLFRADAFITSNGARVVMRGGKSLFVRPIPERLALDTISWLKEQGAAVNAFYNGKALFDRDAARMVIRAGGRISLRRIVFLRILSDMRVRQAAFGAACKRSERLLKRSAVCSQPKTKRSMRWPTFPGTVR